jgi:hypothetical protein
MTQTITTHPRYLLQSWMLTFAFLCISYAGFINIYNGYADDHYRFFGGQAWSWDARPLLGMFHWIFSGMPFIHYTFDAHPLHFYLSLAGLAGIMVAIAHSTTHKIGIERWLAVAVLGVAPFIQENLAYHYDGLGMIISMILAVLPVLFLQQILPRKIVLGLMAGMPFLVLIYDYKIYPLVLVLVALTLALYKVSQGQAKIQYGLFSAYTMIMVIYTYQSAMSIYFALVIFWGLWQLTQNKSLVDIWSILIISFIATLVAFLVFKALGYLSIKGLTVNRWGSGVSFLGVHQLLPTMWTRLVDIYQKLATEWGLPNHLGLAFVLQVIIAMVLVIYRTVQSPYQKWLRVVMAIVLACVMILVPFITILPFGNSGFIARYRTMFSLNIIMAMTPLLIFALQPAKWLKWFVIALVGLVLMISLHFIAVQSYLMLQVTQYVDRTILMAGNDIKQMKHIYHVDKAVINNADIPLPSGVMQIPATKLYPVLFMPKHSLILAANSEAWIQRDIFKKITGLQHGRDIEMEAYGKPLALKEYPHQLVYDGLAYCIYLCDDYNGAQFIYLQWKPYQAEGI